MNTSSKAPPLPRLVAVFGYLGLAPVYMFLPERLFGHFTAHHRRQAAAVWSLCLLLVAVLVVFAVALTYVVLHRREWYEHTALEVTAIATLRRLLLAWLVLAGFGSGLALLGSLRPMPLIGWVARRTLWLRMASLGVLALALLVVSLFGLARYSAGYIAEQSDEAKVFLLYDDVNRYPRAMFTLPFLRMAWAAESAYGPGATAARELTLDSLRTALAQGRVVYLAVHGTAAGLLCEDGFIRPDTVAAMEANSQLRFVYLSGCDSGQLAEQWRAVFAPAEVQTYARLTATLEHVWWMLATGPGVVRASAD